MAQKTIDLAKYIRDIPDFPKEGILYRDITPLLADREAFAAAGRAIAAPFVDSGVDYVAGVEARGFIFGSAVAHILDVGFIPIRKHGKLPYKVESVTYDLEYGTDTLDIHCDAVKPGDTVLMVDDLLATGGTMAAACKLMEKLGAKVPGLAFLIELAALSGRDKLPGHTIHTVISY
ncbi:MAG: adenine phosphoribosyltransferase [Planctomycetes bacterium]|nr:adenine phosphoribosyltransferase [Planctomycetota bacterium]